MPALPQRGEPTLPQKARAVSGPARYTSEGAALDGQLASARAALRAAAEALRRFGRHRGNCLASLGKGRCYPEHCGLDAALAEIRAALVKP